VQNKGKRFIWYYIIKTNQFNDINLFSLFSTTAQVTIANIYMLPTFFPFTYEIWNKLLNTSLHIYLSIQFLKNHLVSSFFYNFCRKPKVCCRLARMRSSLVMAQRFQTKLWIKIIRDCHLGLKVESKRSEVLELV